ncbi:McrC family protein [Lentisalinibacter sediminis]|uniref:McrC family protein n=1 Tax=Lentisalinibacter sediminis TaxID=2992237 RepID=UPI0038631FDA
MLTVSEYGRIFRADSDESLPDGNLRLSKKHFDAVLSILETDEPDVPDYTPILTYLRPRGQEQLRVQNYVGVIRLTDGAQIEVLPKVSKRMESTAARRLLVKMLIELAESPFFEGNAADLDAHNMPLFELLMRCYLEQVTTIARKGIARDYVSEEDNLVFLRGKLNLTEHIRRNSYNSSRVYCSFDEFDIDRPINRLIKGALLIVDRLTKDSTNQQRCRELLFWFDRVPGTSDRNSDFQRLRRDRLAQHYAPAMPLCRLILDSLNPLTRRGENRVVSMLFPMEAVFEAYVTSKIPQQFRDWRVASQVHGKALIEEHRERRMFRLRPDLVLSRGHMRVIADTKWKLIDQANRGERYGISQADVYQLFGYAQKYLQNQEFQEVMLIYPACESFTEPLAPFWYREGNEVLHVLPYKLDTESLLVPRGSLLRQGALMSEVAGA